MNFEEGLAITLDRLGGEANSLGELLQRLRGHVPTVLIGDGEWRQLLELTQPFPATTAAFPLGMELPLHESRPRADLGVSVLGGTEPATFFEDMGRTADSDTTASGIARLLAESEAEDSLLRRIAGRKMMLEYGVDAAPGSSPQAPGIFLRPSERLITGDGQGLRDIGTVLDALVGAAGWTSNPGERRVAERVCSAQGPDTCIDSVGVYPSRERAIKLTVTGFRASRDVVTFLNRAGWPGPYSTVAAAASRLEANGGFVEMGVHLDIVSGRLAPTLRLNFLAKERRAQDPRYWLDRPGLWNVFIDGLRENRVAVPEKLAALANWVTGPTMLFGNSGPFLLLRGIHHFELPLDDAGFRQVKGYAFMVLVGVPDS